MPDGSTQDKPQELEQQFTQAMTEVHSVVPGVFALFGFQLIAAFNDIFKKELRPVEKALYVLALLLLASSAALLMTPAAYHRQVRPHSISDAFANLISRLVAWAMMPLAAVFPIDADPVTRGGGGAGRPCGAPGVGPAIALGIARLLLFVGAWFVTPTRQRRRKARAHGALRRRGHEPAPA